MSAGSRAARAALAALVITSGCTRADPSAPAPAPSASAPRPRAVPEVRTVRGVTFLELFPHDADESAPTVIAMHGMGDDPSRWVSTWSRFPARARVVLPRAHDRYGDGYSWFAYRDGMSDEEFGAEVGRSEAKLWAAIEELLGDRRRVLVTGFSQGAMLSFAMASLHPERVAYAFPVAGSLPGPLHPKLDAALPAPVLAFHGDADTVLALKWGEMTVRSFRDKGGQAELRVFPGVGHSMTPAMREALDVALVAEVEKLRPAPPR